MPVRQTVDAAASLYCQNKSNTVDESTLKQWTNPLSRGRILYQKCGGRILTQKIRNKWTSHKKS